MRYKGSCHCGNIAYEVEGTIDSGLACNCSMCQRKGSLLWFVPRAQFELRTPAESQATYLFNKHFIKHHFCAECGIHPWAEASDAKGNPMAAVNIRTIEGLDLDTIPVKHYDGRSK
jgi:hypothetical protein